MKVLKYIFNFTLVGWVVFSMAGVAHADDVTNKPESPATIRKDKPESITEFLQRRVSAYNTAYTKLSVECILAKIPTEKPQWEWKLDEVYKCAPELAEFANIHIHTELTKDANIRWNSSEEEKDTLGQAALFERSHQALLRIFNFLVLGMNEESSARKAITAYYARQSWYNQKGAEYKEKLKAIDNLIAEYYANKQKCKMVDDHFECDSNTMHKMEKTLKKLSAYFDYNVDSKILTPRGEGVFLHDLDNHSKVFAKNIKRDISLMETALTSIEKLYKEYLRDGSVEQLEKLNKNSVFSYLTTKLPTAVSQFDYRVEYAFRVLLLGMKERAKGDEEPGKLFTQKNMGEFKHLKANSEGSYIRSIRDSLAQILLNTKDRKGNPLKHNIQK